MEFVYKAPYAIVYQSESGFDVYEITDMGDRFVASFRTKDEAISYARKIC